MSEPKWQRHIPSTAAVSEAKLAANQANAQLSTGPKTPEGKARSAQNARTHGLTSRDLVVLPEERNLFEQFQADYRRDLQPEGPLEWTLFEQIVHAAWNLRRCRQLEAELFASSGIDPLLSDDPAVTKKLDRLDRYARRFESALHRAIKELRTVQTNRSQRANVPPEARETIAPRADTAKAILPKRTQPASAPPSDTSLLLAGMARQARLALAGAGRSTASPRP